MSAFGGKADIPVLNQNQFATSPAFWKLPLRVVVAAEAALGSYGLGKEFDFAQYHSLLQAEEEQSRAIASLTTKLRISQQSTYDKSKKKPVDVKRPWET